MLVDSNGWTFSRHRFEGALDTSEKVLGTNKPDDALIPKLIAPSVKKKHLRDAGHPELFTEACRLG